MSLSNKPLISLVVPVYNEEANIDYFYATVCEVLKALENQYQFELVITDNHSTDQTFQKLQAIARDDKRVRVIRFTRNFGYQRSILTGYLSARGQAAIQLDCDLQDPPQMIESFLKKWQQGFKVVYGIRMKRKEGRVITLTRRIFYRVIDNLSEIRLPHDAGDFRLIDRCIIDVLANMQDKQPYLRGAIASIGYEQVGIPYERAQRIYGESKFSLKHLFRLALDGITNHSTLPLRIATYMGMGIFCVMLLAGIGYCVGKFVYGQQWPAGFATIIILMLFSVGLNALFLGIIGEYLGRIYQQIKPGPLTIIEEKLE